MTKKMTHEEFLEKLSLKNQKYAQGLFEVVGTFINTATVIKCHCNNCDKDFDLLAAKLLYRNQGCNLCAPTHKKSEEEFLELLETKQKELRKSGKDIVYLGNFKNMRTEAKFKYLPCGHICERMPKLVLRKNSACPECNVFKKKTHEEYVEKLRETRPGAYPLEQYINGYTEILHFFKGCGHVKKVQPNALTSHVVTNENCTECNKTMKKTEETFLKEIEIRYPAISVLSEYAGNKNNVRYRCNKCKHEWETTPNAMLKDGRYGCPNCSREIQNARMSEDPEQFKNEVAKVNPYVELLEEYTNQSTKIKTKCLICGKPWPADPYSLKQGKGCPKCRNGATSFMEQFLFFSLKKLLPNTEIINNDREFIDGEIDIRIPEKKLAIEIGSWIVHQKRLNKDQKKYFQCKEKGHRLITIYDECPLDKPPFEECYIFHINLGHETGHKTLKSIINWFAHFLKIEHCFSDEEWLEIAKKSYLGSRKMTTEEYRARVKKVHPEIEICSDYLGCDRPVEALCTKCGRTWTAMYANKLYESGQTPCPECKKYLFGYNGSKAVLCVDLGLIYPNSAAAVKTLGITIGHQNINNAIRRKGRSAGHLWKYVDEIQIGEEFRGEDFILACIDFSEFSKEKIA